MTIACLLLSLPLATDPLPATSEAARAELRLHDLSTVATTAESRGDGTNWLLPFIRPHGLVGQWSVSESEVPQRVDDLFSIVAGMYGDELEFEGRRIELLPDGRMAVRAPVAVQDRIAATLRGLEQVLSARVELEVELVQVPEGVELPTAVRLTPEEARTLVARLGQGATSQRLSVSAFADREVTIDLTHDRSLLMGYTLEVAEGAAIHDPVVEVASFGTTLSVRVAPARGGVALSLCLRRGELEGGLEETDLGLRREIALDREVLRASSPSFMQSLELRTGSVALNTVLGRDEVLAVPCSVETARGRLAQLLLVRRTAGSLPAIAALSREEHGTDALLLDTAALAPPRQVFEGRLLASADSPGGFQTLMDNDFEFALLSRLASIDPDPLLEVVLGDLEAVAVERYGSWVFLFPGPSGDASRALDELSGIADRFSAALDAEELVALRLNVLREGPNGAETVASAALPLRTGRASALVLGLERLTVVDFDVEIAKYASAPTPIVAALFDGLALWVRATRTPAGELLVELRGGAHLEELRERTDLASSLYDWVDQAGHEQLLLNERRRLPRDGTGSAVFGPTGPGALRLELSVDG